MVKRWYECRNCGNRFETEVFEPGEAQRKGRPSGPVRCPECQSTDLQPL